MKHTYQHKTVRTLASITSCALLLLPQMAICLQYQVQPTIAGISSDVQLSDLPSNETGTLYVLPPFGPEQNFNFTTDAQGAAQVRLKSNDVQDAGSYALSVTTNTSTNYPGYTLQVSPSSFSAQQSSLTANSTTIEPNGTTSVLIAVIARDELGNVLAGRPFKLISSRPSDQIIAKSNETDSSGQQIFEVRTYAPGTMTLQAIDLITGDTITEIQTIQAGQQIAYGGPDVQPNTLSRSSASPFVGDLLNGRSLYGQVSSFTTLDHFEFEVVKNMRTNEAENLAITAVDKNGNRVENYEGTVLLSSTDPQAILPSFGEIKFEAKDLGRKQTVLALSFSTPGNHLLYGEDSKNANIFGQVQLKVEGRTNIVIPSETISILNPIPNSIIKSNTVLVEGRGSPFINIIVSGGQTDMRSETDADGRFTVEVPLENNKGSHTLQVRSESGNAVSKEITVITDTLPPTVTGLSFDPTNATVGQNVLVTAEVTDDSSGLESVTLLRDNESVKMVNTANNRYEYVFVPDKPGDIRFEVIAKDKAGNSESVIGMTKIRQQPVGTVSNLAGKVEGSIALITWQPLNQIGVTGYRIYIGEGQNGYEYQLETTLTEAKINGLQLGTKYNFAVTALIGVRESEEKSIPLRLEVPNPKLAVSPQNTSLLLEWETPTQEVTIANFRLRYGVQADNLIGQFMLNGDLRRYELNDLINETTYYIELTPISVTGEVLNDLRSLGQGKPTGTDLKPSAGDPVPASILGKGKGKGPLPPPPPPGKIIDTPTQAVTGLPSMISLTGVLLSALGIITWWTKRKRRKQHELFFAHMQQQYTHAA